MAQTENLDRLLERNRGLWEAARAGLWLNPAPPSEPRSAAIDPTHWTLWHQDYREFKSVQQALGPQADVAYGAFPASGTSPRDHVLLHWPREKQRQRMMVQCLAAQMSDTGVLWAYGAKRAGIGSCRASLSEVFTEVTKVDSAGHGSLWRASGPHKAVFDPDKWLQRINADTPAGDLELCSWPGVFAHGVLDDGTALLLDHLPSPKPGDRVLDVACGNGVIGMVMLKNQPGVECVFSDVSALACAATQASLDANALRGQVMPGDGLTDMHGTFDWIVSNPPFHVGHRDDPRLGQRLLDNVGNFLRPGGSVLLVVNRHLNFGPWLAQRFRHCRQRVADRRYEVLQASVPLKNHASSMNHNST